MPPVTDDVSRVVGIYLPNILGAILILVIGYIVAVLVSRAIRAALRRTGLSDRISNSLDASGRASPIRADELAGTIIFWVIMVLVLVAFFQALGLTQVTSPLNSLLGQVFAYVPQLFGALILIAIAWIVATVLRMLIRRVLSAARVDDRVGQSAGTPETQGRSTISNSIAEAVYWLVFLLFLPMILDALSLRGLLAPVQVMLDRFLGFLPNIFAAAVLLLVGWFVARIVQRIVTNLLAAAGVDALSDRVGLSGAIGSQRLSSLLGLIVYVLILIPVIVGALNALGLDEVSRPVSNMLNQMLAALPNILAAVILLALAYVIGRVVAGLVANVLAGAGFDTLPARLGLGRAAVPGERTPSQVVGSLTLFVIMLTAVMEAARLLGFTLLGDIVARFIVFAGQVVLGLIVLAIGFYVANLVYRIVLGSNVENRTLMARIARVAVIALSLAMGLQAMGIANEVINLAFGLFLGAIAVAVGIAFGLGGRDVAARELEGWVRSAHAAADEVPPPALKPPETTL